MKLKIKKQMLLAGGALIALVVGIWLAISSSRIEQPSADMQSSVDAAPPSRLVDANFRSRQNEDGSSSDGRDQKIASTGDDESSTEQTPEELKEEAEEAAVESFDDLTDKWMEPAAKGVTMADVDAFVAQFRKVPKDRQEECLQRALNLVPDENVMLLAGVLMDKSQPKELVKLVFNDVLNRDEDVKKPLLQQIFKDKSHPCWADTAWILDVTGETSK